MPSPTCHFRRQAFRLIGRPDTPDLIDVRTDEDFAADPRLLPGARRRPSPPSPDWAPALRGRHGGRDLPARPQAQPGRRRLAAPCRRAAEVLEGGLAAWAAAGLPLVPQAMLPPRDAAGAHALGHARAAEDRPHRLPLADPPLRRSGRGLPVRRAGRGGRRSPSASAPTPFDIEGEASSGAIAASSAPST